MSSDQQENRKLDPSERKYSNSDITVYWKPNACIHASICFTRLLEVFNPRNRPWVDMQGAPTEKIIDIVNQCPTEALAWKWNDGYKNKSIGEEDKNHIKYMRPDLWELEATGKNQEIEEEEEPSGPVSIQLMDDGPYVVEGSFTLHQADGSKKHFKGMTSFCRCGKTRVPPFCDGTHRKVGFSSSED